MIQLVKIGFDILGNINIRDSKGNCIIEFTKTKSWIEYNGKKYIPTVSVTVSPKNMFPILLEIMQKDIGITQLSLLKIISSYLDSFTEWNLLYKSQRSLTDYITVSFTMFDDVISGHEFVKGLLLLNPRFFMENKVYTPQGGFIIDNSYMKNSEHGITEAKNLSMDFQRTDKSYWLE